MADWILIILKESYNWMIIVINQRTIFCSFNDIPSSTVVFVAYVSHFRILGLCHLLPSFYIWFVATFFFLILEGVHIWQLIRCINKSAPSEIFTTSQKLKHVRLTSVLPSFIPDPNVLAKPIIVITFGLNEVSGSSDYLVLCSFPQTHLAAVLDELKEQILQNQLMVYLASDVALI